MRHIDCSKFLDPRPRNSFHQVECLVSQQWGHWREPSKTGGVQSPRSAGNCRPGRIELDLAVTFRREWPACSRPAASPEASAGYEQLVICGRVSCTALYCNQVTWEIIKPCRQLSQHHTIMLLQALRSDGLMTSFTDDQRQVVTCRTDTIQWHVWNSMQDINSCHATWKPIMQEAQE